MSIYKQKKSRYWWIKFWTNDRQCIRKSTKTDDKSKARLIEQTLKLAHGKEMPSTAIHLLIDTIYNENPTGIPLASAWQEFEAWQRATGVVAEVTHRKRRDAMRRFVSWTEEHWPAAKTVNAVNRQTAAAFAAWLADSGTKGKTRKNIISDLSRVWEGMRHIREGIENPWPFFRPETEDSERGQPFSRMQEDAILKAAMDGPWWLACLIARWTGLRYGDIARLEWADVDNDAGVIRIRPRKTKRHGIAVALPMVPALAIAMRAARAASPDATSVLPTHAATYPRPERAGGPGPFARVLQAAGVSPKDYTFHSWRHTFRTRLSEAGVSDDIAKRLGGWTSDTTAARYDHAARIEEMRAAIETTAAKNKQAAR